jgi:threonylcarbamoyladenosine tRNA methylthiotransferase MtaB
MARVARRPLAAVITLGCKLNLADSEAIARRLGSAGFAVVDHVCEADAFVVNTCSVTHVADQKSRRLIRSVRRLAPGAAVAVTGCFPRTAGGDAVAALGADLVVGTRDADKDALVAFVSERGRPGPAAAQPVPLHTRAFIKAQEGCNDVCAFCIVPRTRGREESRPIATVVAEVQEAAARGAREVVVTGTQLGAWGRDLVPPLQPKDLIAAILAETEVPRVRFSSLQPQDISAELLALWQDPRLMPHFHLALQSGSEQVLRAMRRRYTAAEFRDAAARIRAAVPGVAITTDVIAGFPGETEFDFVDTLALCREVGFARIHAFPFSPRTGTTAARMAGQVPPPVRQERMQRLLALAAELSAGFARAHAGALRPVLWEEERTVDGDPLWFGHTDNYLPVYARGTALRNRITPALLGEPFRDGVWARLDPPL